MTELKPRKFDVIPIVIKNLLIINGLVFLAQSTFESRYGNWIDNTFALHYWGSNLFHPFQLVTHLFMHATLWHLLSNM